MDTLAVILLGFCFSFFAEGTNANSRPNSAVKHQQVTKNWQKELDRLREKYKNYKDPLPVGGVELNAEVLYDTAIYKDPTKWHESTKSKAANAKNVIKEYFESLFKKLEEYLHKQSIYVNITVKSVTENNQLIDYYDQHHKIINAKETLEKLKEHGKSQAKPKHTVFYYFVWPKSERNPYATFDFITTGQRHRLGALEVSTQGTFCSSEVSAALVRHYFGSYIFWSTANATTAIVYRGTRTVHWSMAFRTAGQFFGQLFYYLTSGSQSKQDLARNIS